MNRTEDRPLPAGRLSGAEVLWFGGVTIVAGLTILVWQVNVLTAALGLATWLLYVAVYTPLKSRTPANTAVGAVAGALPVLMGWASVGAPLGLGAATLFLIVYLWQFPHFMAIAWLYREEYARAGLRMLPVVDASGRRAAFQAIASALVLLPVSLLPASLLGAGSLYLAGATLLGLGQLAAAVWFARRLNRPAARGLLRASLVYLPAMLALWMMIPLI
jgi:protoheme IX farnesyltransferase